MNFLPTPITGETHPASEAVQPEPSPAVSVIIPVYNAERYITTCLRSVLSQTLTDIAVIVVDDASSDRSMEFVRRIAKEDTRVKYIELAANAGQGPARNAGIEQARGRYIWFIDADDLFCEKGFLAELYRIAEEDGADMVRGQMRAEHWTTWGGFTIAKRQDPSETFFSTPHRKTDLRAMPDLLHTRHFYGFLYRRTFLIENGIRFINSQWEERPFLVASLLKAGLISSVPLAGYVRTLHLGSTSRRRKHIRDVELIIRNIEQVVDLFIGIGASDPENSYHKHYIFSLSHMLGIFFRGFSMRILQRCTDEKTRAALLAHMGSILRKSGLHGRQLSNDPLIMRRVEFDRGTYAAAFECLRAGEFALLFHVLNEKPIGDQQARQISSTGGDWEFLSVLSRYMSQHPCRPPLRAPNIARRTALPRVLIHIGSTKTGSTYLQHVLDLNRLELLKRGVWYPNYGLRSQSGRPHKTSGHSLFGRDAIWRRSRLRKQLFRTLDNNRDIHTVILSSESFFLSERAHAVLDYLAPLPVQVLVYLRRQDKWADSQYREFVAGGAVGRVTMPPHEWIRGDNVRRLCAYDKLLAPWADKVGTHNIIVRPFETAQLEGRNLLRDFCASAGIAHDGLIEPPDSFKNGLALESRVVLAMRHFNRLPFPNLQTYFKFMQAVTEEFKQSDCAIPAGQDFVIGSEDRRELLRSCMESNAQVARRYLGRNNGEFFLEDDEPAQDETEPYLRIEELDRLFALYHRHVTRLS